MKRFLVAALVLSGCAPQAPKEPPLPPGMVTIATFTAAVDPVAGTISIRTNPTAAGRASGMTGLTITEVTVENDPDAPVPPNPWFNETADRGCGAGTATWGAYVKLTSLLDEPTSLGGVYAEITHFAGPPGSEVCNAAPAPDGLDTLGYGLWSYETIGSLGTASVPWTFHHVSATEFRFGGRIVAAKIEEIIWLELAYPGEQSIGDNGTNVVYASKETPTLRFVNYDGTSGRGSVPLPAYAITVAPDVDAGLIWFTTEGAPGAEFVGYTLSDGTAALFATEGGTGLGALVPDPTVLGRAWYRSESDNYIRSIDAGFLFPVLGTPIDTPFAPYAMAVGPAPEYYLYVTSRTDDRIMVYTTGAAGGDLVDQWAVAPGCTGPVSIVLGQDSKLWIGSKGDDAVCTMTTAGGFAQVNTAVGPRQLAVGPDGKVWVAAFGPNQVARMDAAGPGYRITLPTNAGASGLVAGGGFLWATNDDGLYRILY